MKPVVTAIADVERGSVAADVPFEATGHVKPDVTVIADVERGEVADGEPFEAITEVERGGVAAGEPCEATVIADVERGGVAVGEPITVVTDVECGGVTTGEPATVIAVLDRGGVAAIEPVEVVGHANRVAARALEEGFNDGIGRRDAVAHCSVDEELCDVGGLRLVDDTVSPEADVLGIVVDSRAESGGNSSSDRDASLDERGLCHRPSWYRQPE